MSSSSAAGSSGVSCAARARGDGPPGRAARADGDRGRGVGSQLGRRPASVRSRARRPAPRDASRLYRDLARTLERRRSACGAEPAGLLLVTHGRRPGATSWPDGLSDVASRARAGVPRPGCAHAVEPALAPGVAACRLAIGYPVAPAAATRAYAELATRLRRRGPPRRGRPAPPGAGRVVGVELANGERHRRGRGRRRGRAVDPGAHRPERRAGGRSGRSWGVVVVGDARRAAAPRPRGGRDRDRARTTADDGPAAGRPSAGRAFSLVPAGRRELARLDLPRSTSPTRPRRCRDPRPRRQFVPGLAAAPIGRSPRLRPARQPRRPAARRAGPRRSTACGSSPVTARGGSRPGPGPRRLLADLMTVGASAGARPAGRASPLA